MSSNATYVHIGADGNTTREGEQHLAGLRAYISRLAGLVMDMRPLTGYSLAEFNEVQQARSTVQVDRAKAALGFMGAITDIEKAVFMNMSAEQGEELADLMDRVEEIHMKVVVLKLKLEAALEMCREL